MDRLHEVDRIHAERIAGVLASEFPGVFAPETVGRFVAESYAALAGRSNVTAFLPVMTERFARERLRALARLEGVAVSAAPEVLFVCAHNAGRSLMAAALLDHHTRGRVPVRSAGSAPAGEINPVVIEALAEIGLDVTREFPKPLTDAVARAADVIVTMGCGDACPVFPGKRYLDWQLPDPAGKTLDEVRPIRDEIDRRVRDLLAGLVPANG